MAQLIGSKFNCAVFISGTGTNLNHIIKSSKKKFFPINVSLVISSNFNAYGLNYARKNNIPFKIINTDKMNIFEKNTLKELKKKNIKLICLAGFMKILSKNFIKNFRHTIINIHPSLLPKYKGLNTHSRVLKNNDTHTGCTVHYVSSKLDAGRIILQKKIKVNKKDTPTTLKKRVLIQEHELYSRAIKAIYLKIN